jgi:GR25 family glycosyltransferase involved in LPS biosynthesis
MHIFLITQRNSPRTKLALEHFMGFDLNPQVVYGVQGKALPQELVGKIYLQNKVFRKMLFTEIGCYLSHQLVFAIMVERGMSRALIVEDDARFLQNPRDLFSSLVAMDFGTTNFNVNLYCCDDPVKVLLSKHNELSMDDMTIQNIDVPLWNTVAYFISLGHARQRLLHAFPMIRPIDRLGYLKLNSKYFVMGQEVVCTTAAGTEIGTDRVRLLGRVLRRGTRVRFTIDQLADQLTYRWLQQKFWRLDDTMNLLASLDPYR